VGICDDRDGPSGSVPTGMNNNERPCEHMSMTLGSSVLHRFKQKTQNPICMVDVGAQLGPLLRYWARWPRATWLCYDLVLSR